MVKRLEIFKYIEKKWLTDLANKIKKSSVSADMWPLNVSLKIFSSDYETNRLRCNFGVSTFLEIVLGI